MNKLLLTIIFALIGITLHAQFTFHEGEIFFKVKDTSTVVLPDYDPSYVGTYPHLQSEITTYGITSITRPFTHLNNATLSKIYLVKFDEADYVDLLISDLLSKYFTAYAHKLANPIFTSVPNDYNNDLLWSLRKIDAEGVWNMSPPSQTVKVAIIDDAINILHEDLSSSVYINTSEIAGNGIDDDNNGYIDDRRGWDAADNDSNVLPLPSTVSDDNFSHGTHVAAIACGVNNNGKGVASIGNNYLKLIPIKLSKDISLSQGNQYNALAYALAIKPHVVSMSWGVPDDSTFRSLIHAFSDSVVLLAGAGNSDANTDLSGNCFFPACYSRVIAVGSTDKWDKKSNFSNYGDSVDIMAPGTAIHSAVATTNFSYNYKSGTSMACPLAASVAGMIKAYNPGYTWQQVKNCMQISADVIDIENIGYTGKLGAGRINAYRALNCDTTIISADFGLYDTSVSHTYCVSQQITFKGKNYPNARYKWDFGDGQTAITNNDTVSYTYTSIGKFNITLTIVDTVAVDSSTNFKPDYIFTALCDSIKNAKRHWLFGEYAYLDFGSGIPKSRNEALLDSTINNNEGSVSFSNDTGNLIFYGARNTIRNTFHTGEFQFFKSNHDSFPSYPLTNAGTPAQGLLPVKLNGRVYLFETSVLDLGQSGLHYREWDFINNFFTAAIPVKADSIMMDSDSSIYTTEFITAIPKCDNDTDINNDSYWVITEANGSDPDFANHLLVFSFYWDTTTNQPKIELSKKFEVTGDPPFLIADQSYVRASPDGRFIARTNLFAATTYVLSFNKSNGQLSQLFRLEKKSSAIAFSPNSKYFYVSGFDLANENIYQYDLTAIQPENSAKIIGTSTELNDMRLGPDGKIYIAARTSRYLPVIHFPDERITDEEPNKCGFNNYGVQLYPGTKSGSGLPNFVDALHATELGTMFSYAYTGCKKVQFTYLNSCATYSYMWDFGDTGALDSSTLFSPEYTYGDSGTYQVRLILKDTNGTPVDTLFQTIHIIGDPPTPSISRAFPSSDTVCFKSNVQLLSSVTNSSYTYQWKMNGSTISGQTQPSLTDYTGNVRTFTRGYIVTAISIYGCTATSSQYVIKIDLPDTALKSATNFLICKNDPALLNADTPPPLQTYVWQVDTGSGFFIVPGSSNNETASATLTGTYRFIGTTQFGCSDTSKNKWVRPIFPLTIETAGSYIPNAPNPLELATDTPAPTYNYSRLNWYRHGNPLNLNGSPINVYWPGNYMLVAQSDECGLDTAYVDLLPNCASGTLNTTFQNGGNANGLYNDTDGYVVGNNDTLFVRAGDTANFENTALFMGDCSMILVEETGWLIMDSVNVTGCGNWIGIVVLGDPLFARPSSIHTIHGYLDMNNCRVSDADVGVLCQDGGFASIRETQFENNYVHFGAQDYSFPDSTTVMECTFGKMKNNTSCTHPYFSNLINYTDLTGATFSLHHAAFVQNNEFVQFLDNEFTIDYSFPFAPQITDFNNLGSIVCYNAKDIKVISNKFRSCVRYGIVFKDCEEDRSGYFRVEQNMFNGEPAISLNGFGVNGILAETTDDLYCGSDTFTNLVTGFTYYGGNNDTVYFDHNTVTSNLYGLVTAVQQWPLTTVTGGNTSTASVRTKVYCNKFTNNDIGWVNSGNMINQGIFNVIDASNSFSGNNISNIASADAFAYYHMNIGGSPSPTQTISPPVNIDGVTFLSSSVNPTNSILGSTCFGQWKFDPSILNRGRVNETAGLIIYPNPFDTYFTLITEGQVHLTIQVFDVIGKELHLPVANTEVGLEVMTGNLAAGMYVVKVTDYSGKVVSFKLIKATN